MKLVLENDDLLSALEDVGRRALEHGAYRDHHIRVELFSDDQKNFKATITTMKTKKYKAKTRAALPEVFGRRHGGTVVTVNRQTLEYFVAPDARRSKGRGS